MEEFGQIRRGKFVEYLDFEVYAQFDREQVELLLNRDDVVDGGGSGDDPSCRVLNQLKFTEGL